MPAVYLSVLTGVMHRTPKLANIHVLVDRNGLILGPISGTKSEMVIKAVVFDMGGVLIPAPTNLVKDLEEKNGFPPGSLVSIFQKLTNYEHFKALEKGEITGEDFDSLFTDLYNKEHGTTRGTISLATAVAHLYPTMKMIPEMEQIIKDLRAVGCMTIPSDKQLLC
ncbi:hypothetical protein KIN20_003455 [Parelaphostrongylus tenuis]|uniref:Uncharacterized protein n=1 Tax=Parelaphostrongylus tenuis TaxID=148309 RepID=A0AAD5QHF5_PARTN|nr:hypothetical protein KIN20_003455 [Parelaphostrongylus tenuis]